MNSVRRTLTETKDSPELKRSLEESAAAFAAMPPEQKEEMLRQQRESWARQDMD